MRFMSFPSNFCVTLKNSVPPATDQNSSYVLPHSARRSLLECTLPLSAIGGKSKICGEVLGKFTFAWKKPIRAKAQSKDNIIIKNLLLSYLAQLSVKHNCAVLISFGK